MRSTYIDPDVGMMRTPGSSVYHDHPQGGYLAKCNSLGMRDHEVSPERVDGRPRMIVVGDSFTFGSGVEVIDRFTTRMAERWPDWDFVNFGLSGAGVDQQFQAWRKFARNVEHDLVLVTSWAENIRRNLARYRLWDDRWGGDADGTVVWVAKPYFELDEGGELALCQVPCPPPAPYDAVSSSETDTPRFNRLRLLVRTLGVKEAMQRVTRMQPLPEYDSADTDAWILMRAILRLWEVEAERTFVFAPVPMYQYVEGTASAAGYQRRLAELRASGMDVIDVLPAMRAQPDRRRMRHPIDTHFSPLGHGAYALAVLEQLGPIVERHQGS